jgi:hypothetical protein
MIFNRNYETKFYVVFISKDDEDVSGFGRLYVKKSSPLSELLSFELERV